VRVRAANYEYGFYWYFGQDGSIQHEVKLTGEVSTTLAHPGDGDDPRFGTLVLPNVVAAHHQHLFVARLDMAVDDEEGGKGLVVSEVLFLSYLQLCVRVWSTRPAHSCGA